MCFCFHFHFISMVNLSVWLAISPNPSNRGITGNQSLLARTLPLRRTRTIFFKIDTSEVFTEVTSLWMFLTFSQSPSR